MAEVSEQATDWQQRAVEAEEALRDLDAALSGLWREGPVDLGHPNYIDAVDEAWKAARAVLRFSVERKASAP